MGGVIIRCNPTIPNYTRLYTIISEQSVKLVYQIESLFFLRGARIKKIFDVPFSRPRNHELKKDKSFFKFVNEVQKEFELE